MDDGRLAPLIILLLLTILTRICPGRYLAMNSMFIAVASILWTFNLEKARDKDGNEVLPDDKAYLPDFLMCVHFGQ